MFSHSDKSKPSPFLQLLFLFFPVLFPVLSVLSVQPLLAQPGIETNSNPTYGPRIVYALPGRCRPNDRVALITGFSPLVTLDYKCGMTNDWSPVSASVDPNILANKADVSAVNARALPGSCPTGFILRSTVTSGSPVCTALTVSELPPSAVIQLPTTGSGQLCYDAATQVGGFFVSGACVYPSSSSTPSITSSVSPSSRTIYLGGASGAFTDVITAANIIPTISVSTSGAPTTGITFTASATTVPNTGGTVTYTFAADWTAAPGTYPITFNATGGSTSATPVVANLVISAPATYMTDGGISTFTSLTIPTSDLNWRMYGQGGDSKTGSSLAQPACSNGATLYTDPGAGLGSLDLGATVSWTNGISGSGSTTKSARCYNGSGNMYPIVLTIPIPDASLHHVAVIYGHISYGGDLNVTMTSHLANASAADLVVSDYIVDSGSVYARSALIAVKSSGATTMTISISQNAAGTPQTAFGGIRLVD